MAFIDRRDKSKVYKDGSSLIAAGLTTAQAQEALGDVAATAGWYGLGYMAGGNVGRDNNDQIIRDEAKEPITSTGTIDDFTIQNTSQQTDAKSLKLYEWLEKNEVPVRYILPTPDPATVQVHYHPAMSVDVGSRSISTSAGVRTMQFTLRGAKGDHAFEDLAADQSDWATTSVEDAMDTVFPPA